MASVHGRINYKNCKFIGSCFNAKAARLRCVGKAKEVSKQLGASNFGCPLLVLCLLSMMSRMLSSQVVLGNGFSASS